MRDYELVVLYHPDLEIDLDKALKKVEGLIKDAGGKVSFSESWGKRKLAYPIKKQEYAIYVYYEIQLTDDSVKKLESQLNITDEVIRYLITKPTPNFGDRDKKMLVEDDANVAQPDDEESDHDKKAKKEVKKSKEEDKQEDNDEEE